MRERPDYSDMYPRPAVPNLEILDLNLHEWNTARILHRPQGVKGVFLAFFHSDALVRLRGIDHRVPPSTLVIWEPGQQQYYGNDRSDWDHSWLHCAGAAIVEQLSASSIPTGRVLPLDSTVETEQFFRSLQQERALHPTPNADVLQCSFSLWFAQLKRLLCNPAAQLSIPPEWLAIKRYLDEHFAEPITIEMLTDQICFSRQHFSRAFKQYFGIPAMEYLKRKRLEQARFLLLDNNLSITDIARRVGYHEYRPFSTLFSHYFGVSPINMRKGVSGETVRERLSAERRNLELDRWTREGWIPQYQADFTTMTCLDPHWDIRYYNDYGQQRGVLHTAPQLAKITEGCLHLQERKETDWTEMRFSEDIGEETKVAVRVQNTPPDGLNLVIAISGDLQAGYRLRIYGYDYVALETVRNGYWELLYRCPITLDPHAADYTFVLWRSENVFYAELEDGQRIMTYPEPFAAYGAAHRTISLGRKGFSGDARIRSLHIWSRRSPRYVDILEPGRVLLRLGRHEEAMDWFLRVASDHVETDIQHEAHYLAALAIRDTAGEARETALLRVIANTDNPFRTRALRELTLLRLQRHDFHGIIECCIKLQTISPDDSVFPHLAQTMINYLAAADITQHSLIMQAIAQLPVAELNFIPIPLTSLTALHGMHLSTLECGPGYLDDLSPLAGMPLTHFSCSRNNISDLTPFAGMSLSYFGCTHNQVADLAPLAGMALELCDVTDNHLIDLSPLTGMPLTQLRCGYNTITDLTPLKGMPLRELDCSVNQILDLSPLANMPLISLDCTANRIVDLHPLAGLPLKSLSCSRNPIRDLSPLASTSLTTLLCVGTPITNLQDIAQLPLTYLSCAETAVTDLTPLACMPLSVLRLGSIPLRDANAETVAALPLRELYCDCFDADTLSLLRIHPTLQSVNGHDRAHVLTVAPAAYAALTVWRTDPNTALSSRYALREYAVSIGNRAYLALPLMIPRQEAIAFCHWQGGILVSPATETAYAELLQYLASVVRSDEPVNHHLGLEIDHLHRTAHWPSQLPYTWHRWRLANEPFSTGPPISPVFVSNATYEHHLWWNSYQAANLAMYTVIEW